MLVKLGPFMGMQLRAGAELLPNQPSAADTCKNCKFPSGYLEPWREPEQARRGQTPLLYRRRDVTPAQRFWRFANGSWLAPTSDGWRFATAPGQYDRYDSDETQYLTTAALLVNRGQAASVTFSRAADGPTWYAEDGQDNGPVNFAGDELGNLDKPTWSSTGSSLSDVAGAGYSRPRQYAYTVVNDLGWESYPSFPSDAIDAQNEPVLDGKAVRVTILNGASYPAGYRIRLYRTVAGREQAAFRFVKEVPRATTIDENETDRQLGAILHTQTWAPMPRDLDGLTVFDGRFAVGWKDKEIMFSVADEPHAWPFNQRHTLPHAILAVATLGGALVVLTQDGPPYVSAGRNPVTMQFAALPTEHHCVAVDSVAIIQDQVFYAAKQGIASVTQGRTTDLPTATVASWEGWNEFVKPETIHAARHRGRYVATAERGESTDRFAFCFDPVSSSFTELDHNVMGDPDDPERRIGYIIYAEDDELFFAIPEQNPKEQVDSSAGKVFKLEGSNTSSLADWKSKSFVLAMPARLSTFKAVLDSDPRPAVPSLEATLSSPVERLTELPEPTVTLSGTGDRPMRFRAPGKFQELNVDMTVRHANVKRCYVCESPAELAGQL